MILPRRRSALICALALAAGFFGCAGENLTLPSDAQPTNIDAVTGNAQAGIAGTALALPLVVKVSDDLGRPVVGQAVEYSVTGGGGQVAPASTQTGTDGRASAVWTLGPAAGSQQVRAQVVGRGAPAGLGLDFSATAVAGTGSLLAAVSGDDQSSSVSSILPESLIVRASDASGNPVSGVTIQWTVQGGGSISPATVVTGDDGLAAAQRVLGAAAGQQSAQASSDGLAGSPVTFVHSAVASAPSVLAEVSGNGQTAPAGFEVAEDLVVRLTDDNGNGVAARAVTWVVSTGGGTVSPVNSTTDANGFARTRWTLGTTVGSNTLNAVVSGISSVPFTASASADVPSKIVLAGGDGQLGTVGQALATALSVTVTDANDNPVENVSVAWTPSGGGTVSSATSATDLQGIARVTRTLGPTPGTYATQADVPGLAGTPVAFTSTAVAGAAARLAIVTQPGGTARSGAPLSPQPVVQVQDAQGNSVGPAGHTVSADLASVGGATLGGTRNRTSDGNGRVSYTDLAISGPAGNYRIQFTSGSLTPVTSTQVTLTAGAVSATQSAVDAAPGTVAAGAASTVTVTARDAGGNPVQGANVTLAATGNANTIGQPGGTTNASGQITGTFASTSVGQHVITATINGTAISDNATVTVTPGAVSAGQSTVDATPNSIAAGALSTITVTARDAGGNLISGASVTLSATGTGNTLGQPSATTNASGVATGTFSSTGTGPHTITATVNGTAISDNAIVTVGAGPVSAAQSTVDATPNSIAAGALSTITVTARDAGGNPISGASVTLSATGTGNTLTQPSGATNGSGVTTGTFSSTSTGPHTITATINGVGITDNSIVTVTPGPVSAVQSTVDATPNSVAVGAASTITVTARDAGGNPIAGASVALAATGAGNTLVQPAGATNSSGVATGAFSSTAIGPHTITATINGVGINDNAIVTVTAGAVSATLSQVTAAPDPIAAGGAQSTITVTARDGAGNPVGGANVSLSVSGSGNSVSAPGPTNSAGVTTASFSSTQAGAHVITATINGTAISDNATVTVLAGSVATLRFVQQPTQSQVGQPITPAPAVAVEDQFGNSTAGTVTVSLNQVLSSGTLSGTLTVTAVDGVATFSDLSIDDTGFFYSLTATSAGVSVTSTSFFVGP